MSVSFKVENVPISAVRDRAMFNTFAGNQSYVIEGIGDELSVTHSSSSFVVELGTGEAVICGGSMLSEGESTTLTLNANESGYLVIEIDLSQTGSNICKFTNVSSLVQGNINNGTDTIYDLPLYEYTTNGSGVSNIIDVREKKSAVTSQAVTSVRVQATSPVVSSESTEQTSSLDTTISLANGYGDTKNPYGNKNKNLVLASDGSTDNKPPTFRALVANDIPNLNASKITAGTLPVARGGTGVTSVAKNVVFAGNSSSDNQAPSFRTLVANDIPNLNASKITAGTLPVARGGTGVATLTANNRVFAGPVSGASSSNPVAPSFRALQGADIPAITVQTSAPTANYTGTGIRIVYLTSEPTTKYTGYIYLIKG